MQKQGLSLMAVFLGGAVLIGCDANNYNSSAPGGAGTTPSPGASPMLSNSELERRITEKLNADAQFKGADFDVDADASQNSVTISGHVESQELRSRVIEMARSVQPGLTVNDKLEVRPREISRAEYTEERAREDRQRARERGETVGANLDDAWIHTKVVAKLIGNTETPQRKINVDVNNNVVTLRGTVETAEAKAEAERVAKATEGVKRVINQLKVGAS
jgi:hyperosmotically inducible periplasmic protein